MADARELLQKIRTGLKPFEEKILRHRYLEALQTGRVAREKLRIFAGQQYHIIASDLRSIALLLCRHGNLASRPTFSRYLRVKTPRSRPLRSLRARSR